MDVDKAKPALLYCVKITAIRGEVYNMEEQQQVPLFIVESKVTDEMLRQAGEGDYYTRDKRLHKLARLLYKICAVLLCILIVVCAIVAILTRTLPPPRIWILIPVAAIFLWFVWVLTRNKNNPVARLYGKSSLTTNKKRNIDLYGGNPRSILSFYDDYLSDFTLESGGMVNLPYAKVKKAFMTPDTVVLRTEALYYIVSKSDFTKGDVETFLPFIREKCAHAKLYLDSNVAE